MKNEIVDGKNFIVDHSREFLCSHDRILLDLEEFENFKDKWKELRVNFGKKEGDQVPASGGS